METKSRINFKRDNSEISRGRGVDGTPDGIRLLPSTEGRISFETYLLEANESKPTRTKYRSPDFKGLCVVELFRGRQSVY